LEALEVDDLGSQCSGELLASLCAGPTTSEFQAAARQHLAAPQQSPSDQPRLQRGLCFLAFTLGDGRGAEERGIVVGPRPAATAGGAAQGSWAASGRPREAERAALDIVLAAGAGTQQQRNQQQKVLGQVQIHIAHTPCAAFLATLPALRGRFMIWISFDDAWEGRWGESLPSQQYRHAAASGDAGGANRGGRGRQARPAPWSIEREYDCWGGGDPNVQAGGSFAPSPRHMRNSTGNIGAQMASRTQPRVNVPKAGAGVPGAAGRIFQAATSAAVGQGGGIRQGADDSPSSPLTPRQMQTLGQAAGGSSGASQRRPVVPPLGGMPVPEGSGMPMPENNRPVVPPLGGMPVPEGSAVAPVPFAPRLSLPVERDPGWSAWQGPMSVVAASSRREEGPVGSSSPWRTRRRPCLPGATPRTSGRGCPSGASGGGGAAGPARAGVSEGLRRTGTICPMCPSSRLSRPASSNGSSSSTWSICDCSSSRLRRLHRRRAQSR